MQRLALVALLSLLSAAGCGNATNSSSASGGASGEQPAASEAQAPEGEVIAVVNGMPITKEEFERAAMRKAPSSGPTLNEEEKKEVLDQVVAEKLLYQEALKRGLDKDPKVIKVIVNTLLREDVFKNIKNSDFSEDVLKAYYEQHKDEFTVPPKVHMRRILIRVNDERPEEEAKAMAERIYKQVKADPSKFEEVAGQVSEDAYKRRGGDVGFVSKEGKPGLDQAIVEKAFEMEAGQISEPFRTDEGYNIIQVVAKRDAVERTFQQMKGSVLRKVKSEKLKELYDQYVAQLKEGAKVEVYEDRLQALEVTPPRRGPGMPWGQGDGGPGRNLQPMKLHPPGAPKPPASGESKSPASAESKSAQPAPGN